MIDRKHNFCSNGVLFQADDILVGREYFLYTNKTQLTQHTVKIKIQCQGRHREYESILHELNDGFRFHACQFHDIKMN